jgi:YfiH family protein
VTAPITDIRPQLIHSGALAHVPHAFTTRLGGVSSGLFASLNFGNPGDLRPEAKDPPANIRENWRRVLRHLGAAARELVEVYQVHGDAVHVIPRDHPAHAAASDTRADALVTDDPGRIIAIRIADCAPVLISSADGRVVAAVHAGWRGVVAGVLPAAVRSMRQLRPESCDRGMAAAIGPCISSASFEVGPEVGEEFRRVFGADTPHVRSGRDDRLMIDLKAALAEQLSSAGVRSVEILPHCTYGQPNLFFSHRRATHEGVATGRLAAIIGPRPG